MSNPLQEFLANHGVSNDLKHYGVKGMTWGKRRTDTNGDGLVDSLLENVNSGGDLDDLELESAGAAVDALLDGVDPDTNLSAERIFTPDSNDKFWETAGRNLENFFGGKKAQKARNMKMAKVAAASVDNAKEFLGKLFGN